MVEFDTLGGTRIAVNGWSDFAPGVYVSCTVDGRRTTRPYALLPIEVQVRVREVFGDGSDLRRRRSEVAKANDKDKGATRRKGGKADGKSEAAKQEQGSKTVELGKGRVFELVEYTDHDVERLRFPKRMSQQWLEASVPAMDDRQFGMLLLRLTRSGWGAGPKGTIATRVLPLRTRPGSSGR